MKKSILFIGAVLLLSTSLNAQPSLDHIPSGSRLQPIRWKYTAQRLSRNTIELHLTAFLNNGWHLYSQHQSEDAIALPTVIRFDPHQGIILTGKPSERGKLEKITLPALGITNRQYANQVDFIQKIELKKNAPASISGSIRFQCCTDEQCLPPETINFTIPIGNLIQQP